MSGYSPDGSSFGSGGGGGSGGAPGRSSTIEGQSDFAFTFIHKFFNDAFGFAVKDKSEARSRALKALLETCADFGLDPSVSHAVGGSGAKTSLLGLTMAVAQTADEFRENIAILYPSGWFGEGVLGMRLRFGDTMKLVPEGVLPFIVEAVCSDRAGPDEKAELLGSLAAIHGSGRFPDYLLREAEAGLDTLLASGMDVNHKIPRLGGGFKPIFPLFEAAQSQNLVATNKILETASPESLNEVVSMLLVNDSFFRSGPAGFCCLEAIFNKGGNLSFFLDRLSQQRRVSSKSFTGLQIAREVLDRLGWLSNNSVFSETSKEKIRKARRAYEIVIGHLKAGTDFKGEILALKEMPAASSARLPWPEDRESGGSSSSFAP